MHSKWKAYNLITQRTTYATIDHAVALDALTIAKADAKTWWYVFTLGNILFFLGGIGFPYLKENKTTCRKVSFQLQTLSLHLKSKTQKVHLPFPFQYECLPSPPANYGICCYHRLPSTCVMASSPGLFPSFLLKECFHSSTVYYTEPSRRWIYSLGCLFLGAFLICFDLYLSSRNHKSSKYFWRAVHTVHSAVHPQNAGDTSGYLSND